MIVVVKGTVQHNGSLYGTGEVITDIKKKEAERLVKLGVCQEIADAPATAVGPKKPEPPQSTGQQEDTPGDVSVGDLGLTVNPAATIQK